MRFLRRLDPQPGPHGRRPTRVFLLALVGTAAGRPRVDVHRARAYLVVGMLGALLAVLDHGRRRGGAALAERGGGRS